MLTSRGTLRSNQSLPKKSCKIQEGAIYLVCVNMEHKFYHAHESTSVSLNGAPQHYTPNRNICSGRALNLCNTLTFQ